MSTKHSVGGHLKIVKNIKFLRRNNYGKYYHYNCALPCVWRKNGDYVVFLILKIYILQHQKIIKDI